MSDKPMIICLPHARAPKMPSAGSIVTDCTICKCKVWRSRATQHIDGDVWCTDCAIAPGAPKGEIRMAKSVRRQLQEEGFTDEQIAVLLELVKAAYNPTKGRP